MFCIFNMEIKILKVIYMYIIKNKIYISLFPKKGENKLTIICFRILYQNKYIEYLND